MQFLLFLFTSLFATTAYPGSTDLFSSDPQLFNSDASNPDAHPIFDDDDVSQLSTNDIWTDGGSELLTFDADDRYFPSMIFIVIEVDYPMTFGSNNEPLNTESSSLFDVSSNPQISFPPDLSTLSGAINLPDQEVSDATGDGCSINSMMGSPISRRDGLDWLWNILKGTESSPNSSPKVCPAPPLTGAGQSLEPNTQTGGDGPDGENDRSAICGDDTLVCCRDSVTRPLVDLEQCWDCELIRGVWSRAWTENLQIDRNYVRSVDSTSTSGVAGYIFMRSVRLIEKFCGII